MLKSATGTGMGYRKFEVGGLDSGSHDEWRGDE